MGSLAPELSAWCADHDEPSKVNAPLPSTTMQNDADGHDTAKFGPPLLEPTLRGFDHPEPSQLEARPTLVTATQKEAEAHETAANGAAATRREVVHEDPLYVKALPPLSTAAQKRVVGHETEMRLVTVSTARGADQAVPL